GNLPRAITLGCRAVGPQAGRLRAQPHRATFFRDALLLFQQANHRMRIVLVELGGMGVLQPEHISGVLPARALPAQANAKERYLPLANEADGVDLAFDAAFAETTRHEHAIHPGEQPLGAFALDHFAMQPLDTDLSPIAYACMIECLVNRLVRIAMLCI